MHGTPRARNTDDATCGIDYCAAATMDQREAAFGLVYDAYLESGLARPNANRMRILPHHLLSSTELFVASREGQVVSTVTLIRDGDLGLPMEEVYPDEIEALRLMNRRVGEVSCLASQEQLNLKVCLELFRVMVQAARQRGVDALLVAIHPRHEKFYRRFLAFETLGGCTSYPAVCNQPAVALVLDFDRIDIERPANWGRFFGDPLPEETLRQQPMTVADRRHLANLLLETQVPCPAIGSDDAAHLGAGQGQPITDAQPTVTSHITQSTAVSRLQSQTICIG